MLTNLKNFLVRKSELDACLPDSEIERLHNKAKQSYNHFSETIRKSSENMVGNLQSSIHGTGLDFEEYQPYQPGSDSRHINWRTFAKTQQLYINIYTEDKRPSTYLLFDQREDMYFATRKQLKIKLALNFAVYTIFCSLYQQKAISGVVLRDKAKWFPRYSNSGAFYSLVNDLNTSVDYRKKHTKKIALNDVLNKLSLTPGTELILISDLHDMNDETIRILNNLSSLYRITILQIQDPVESQLPERGLFKIKNNANQETLNVNCNDKTVRESYIEHIAKKIECYQQQCINMGIEHDLIMTTTDF